MVLGKVGVEIESPLSLFNNYILKITSEFEHLFEIKKDKNVLFRNNLIFEKSAITFYGKFKILFEKNIVSFKFMGNLNTFDMTVISIIIEKEAKFRELFNQYLFMYNIISNNLDSNISHKYIETIHNKIISGAMTNQDYFVIPIKEKILKLYDFEDKTLDIIYNRFSYIVKFDNITKTHFRYKIVRVTSSLLDDSKSLNNLRFEDIEIVTNDLLEIDKLQDFLLKLFYYGEILK